jgi:hypothetical protein
MITTETYRSVLNELHSGNMKHEFNLYLTLRSEEGLSHEAALKESLAANGKEVA